MQKILEQSYYDYKLTLLSTFSPSDNEASSREILFRRPTCNCNEKIYRIIPKCHVWEFTSDNLDNSSSTDKCIACNNVAFCLNRVTKSCSSSVFSSVSASSSVNSNFDVIVSNWSPDFEFESTWSFSSWHSLWWESISKASKFTRPVWKG